MTRKQVKTSQTDTEPYRHPFLIFSTAGSRRLKENREQKTKKTGDQEVKSETKTSVEPEETIIPEDTEMTDIQKILAEFTNIDGVHTACLVGRDGFLLDNIARAGIDAEMIGAIASSGFGSAESMGNQLGQGDLNLTMLEYTDGPVMFASCGQ